MADQLSAPEALAVYNKVITHYTEIITPGWCPELMHNWEKTWDSPDPVAPWAIVWHDGPEDWAISVSQGDVIPRHEAFVEPGTGQVLTLWPTD